MRMGKVGPMKPRIPILLALLAGFLGAGEGFAQVSERMAVDIWGMQVVSGPHGLEQGIGSGVSVVLRLRDPSWLGIGFGAALLSNESERQGVSCRSFTTFVPSGCSGERLGEEVTLGSFRFSVRPAWEATDQLRIEGGLGVAIHSLRATSTGVDTERPGNLYIPLTSHPGAIVDVGVSWSLPRLPIALGIGVTNQVIWFEGCQESQHFFAPYCGMEQLATLRFGLSFRQ
jgi:hypothetical protein